MNLTLAHHKNQKETAVITTTREARPRRLTSTLLWAVQILLAVFFLNAAVPKLTGSHSSVQEFGLIGAGQWFRYFVGILELAGVIGLLTPGLAGLAAAGLAADMAGATIINATVLHNTTFGPNVWLTAILCAVFVLLAYGRRQQIKGLAAAIRRVKNAGPGREDPSADGVGDGSGQELCPGP
jgi:putative oxidoreductase